MKLEYCRFVVPRLSRFALIVCETHFHFTLDRATLSLIVWDGFCGNNTAGGLFPISHALLSESLTLTGGRAGLQLYRATKYQQTVAYTLDMCFCRQIQMQRQGGGVVITPTRVVANESQATWGHLTMLILRCFHPHSR